MNPSLFRFSAVGSSDQPARPDPTEICLRYHFITPLEWTKKGQSCITSVLQERDRERANARNGAKGKGKDDGLTPEQRRERDAKALQEKLAKKAAGGAAGGGGTGGLYRDIMVSGLNVSLWGQLRCEKRV
ncbi:hypothetical protein LguiA_001732 [Lonicera macranthoides]